MSFVVADSCPGKIIISLHFDILLVIAEIFSEQCEAAAVGGILGDGKSQIDGTVVINMQILYSGVGDPVGAVNEGAVGIDDQGFQEAILIQQFATSRATGYPCGSRSRPD